MSETDFCRDVIKSLRIEDPSVYVHSNGGGGYCVAGLPDIECCHLGRFIGFECKFIKELPARDDTNVFDHNTKFKPMQEQKGVELIQAKGFSWGLTYVSELRVVLITGVDKEIYIEKQELLHRYHIWKDGSDKGALFHGRFRILVKVGEGKKRHWPILKNVFREQL